MVQKKTKLYPRNTNYSYIDADNRRSNVLLHNDNGSLVDNNGNNYTQSYLDEENVPVIVGKMPRDTSPYFDPFGALTFASAAAAPITNFTPSNIVGSIRKAHDYNSFMDSFMNQNNNGFFTDTYAQEHPYLSILGNMAGDAAVGWLGNKAIDGVRNMPNLYSKALNGLINNSARYRGWIARQYANGKDYADDVLDNAYLTAYRKSLDDVVKSLRDTHFVRKANDALLDENGKPILLFHTTSAENPNFHVFDTNIEGRPTAIYTTDDAMMSSSYNPSMVYLIHPSTAKSLLKNSLIAKQASLKEADKLSKILTDLRAGKIKASEVPLDILLSVYGPDFLNVKPGPELEDFMESLITVYKDDAQNLATDLIERKHYAPELMKRLYSNSSSKVPSTVVQGDGRNWNNVPLIDKKSNPELWKNIEVPDGGGISTRGYEKALMKSKGKAGDRIVITNITDYASQRGMDMSPHMVVENLNPSDLKYSNPVTYGDNQLVIPLSLRDNFLNPDMRYKKGGKFKLFK